MAEPAVSQTTNVDPRRHRQAIHWRVPTVMLGSLLAGTVAAVGHHLFYNHYNDMPVRDSTEQRYISNGGTAFAFLVKMFLAIATGTAYVQLFWLSLKTASRRLERVDRLYSVLGNVTLFWDLGLWFRNPLLSTLAIVTWMLPLAVIITPGTLIIQTSYESSQLVTKPPQLSLDTDLYAIWFYAMNPVTIGGVNYLIEWNLQGPQSQVMAITAGAGVQQSILPIKPPHSNSSYYLEFIAPALKCAEPPQANITAFRQALDTATNKTSFNIGSTVIDAVLGEVGQIGLVYNAWAPDESHVDLSNPNWNKNGSVYVDSTSGKYPGSTTFFYIGQVNTTNVSGYKVVYTKTMMLQCTLYNATYDVQFNFSGTHQDIRTSNVKYLNPVPPVLDTYEDRNTSAAYTAIIWAFNQLLVGTGIMAPGHGQTIPNYVGTLAQSTALRKYIEETEALEFNAVKETIEQMFQNITLSFLSSDNFLLNSTASKFVSTTIATYPLKYQYQPKDIYIAYGGAILCSLICVSIGCIALLQNGISYSNDLTTVIRTTRRKEITDLVSLKHSLGGDPLDERIGLTVVQFKTGDHRQHHDQDDDQDEMCGFTTLQNGVEEKMMPNRHAEDFVGINELPRPPHRGPPAPPAIRRKPLPQAQYQALA